MRVDMETSDEIKKTEEALSVECSASKTDIPIPDANQQAAIAHENDQQPSTNYQRKPPQSSAVVGNVPTSKSKSAPPAGEPVATISGAAGEYEVEDILDHIKVQGKALFLVKWKNYGHESNSWESREDLTNCKLAISAYFRRSLINYENAVKKQQLGLQQ